MTPKTVLIVDDDPDQHVLCGLYLEHAGYAVEHAYDGREGYESARATRPAVILMDLRMPELDGVGAFRLLAADADTQGIPVVALSADVMDWSESRALREGFTGHIAKPCDLRKIREMVQRIAGPALPRTAAGDGTEIGAPAAVA
ncbi:MAG TPA: response regulator [Longimicrobiaceae bacterium]|nr:response regulator [Longimicrobiaceae bacterium]